jgi:hypothetical protein
MIPSWEAVGWIAMKVPDFHGNPPLLKGGTQRYPGMIISENRLRLVPRGSWSQDFDGNTRFLAKLAPRQTTTMTDAIER